MGAACYAVLFKARLLMTLLHLDTTNRALRSGRTKKGPIHAKSYTQCRKLNFYDHMKPINDALVSFLTTSDRYFRDESSVKQLPTDWLHLYAPRDGDNVPFTGEFDADVFWKHIAQDDEMLSQDIYDSLDGVRIPLSWAMFEKIDSEAWFQGVFRAFIMNGTKNEHNWKHWKLAMCNTSWSHKKACYAVRVVSEELEHKCQNCVKYGKEPDW